MKSSSVDMLGTELTKIINEYASDIKDRSLERLDQTADEILDYIKSNAPKGKSKYHLADSFVKTEVGEGLRKKIYISSKTKARLVHLVELGFKHRNGKHVAARPFLRPAYDTFTPQMIEDIKKIINGGS